MAATKASCVFLFQFFCLCFSLNNSLSGSPNIIIFMTDNLSIGNLSIYNNNSQQTPNIDRLVIEGVLFSRWYTQSSRISSLASILTGLLPPRTGMIKSKFLSFKEIPSLASTGGLQHSQITLAEVLKAKNYVTSFVGLWGLGVGINGDYLPLNHGFDSWYGVPSAHKEHCTENYRTISDSQYMWESFCSVFRMHMLLYISPVVVFIIWYKGHSINMFTVFTVIVAFIFYISILHDVIHFAMDLIQIRSCVLYKNSNIIEQPYTAENMTLRFTRSAVSFLEMSSVSSKPFFLFVSFMNLNYPVFASRLFSNSTQSTYYDALKEVDWSVGRIMRTLREHDVDDNTLILFTSATGYHVDDSSDSCTEDKDDIAARGRGKNDVWEQTIRVPAVFRWPGHIAPSPIIKTPVTVMDIMPTVLELLNHSADALQSDGKSLLPILFNVSAESQHKHIFHYVEVTKPAAITTGKYKVVYTNVKDDGTVQYFDPPLLFNVETDPEERSPLPNTEHTELLANMSDALVQHIKTRKNKWHSQLDSRINPFWFPCANSPHCFQANDETTDFSDLFNS